MLELAGNGPVVRGGTLDTIGVFEAMSGHFDEARRLYEEGIAILRDLGRVVELCLAAQGGWLIGWLAGDLAMAEREMRWSCDLLEEHGVNDLLAVNRDQRGEALYALGRFHEAEALGVLGRDGSEGHPQDLGAQWAWRRILGNVAAARGELVEAERLLREAFEIGERSDSSSDRATTHMELAEVLRLAGRPSEAMPLLEAAAQLSEQREDVVTAGKARTALASLG